MSNWIWRDGEIQYKEFLSLTSTAKQEHINFLLKLNKNELSSNDEFILRMFGPKTITKKFLTLDDEKEINKLETNY